MSSTTICKCPNCGSPAFVNSITPEGVITRSKRGAGFCVVCVACGMRGKNVYIDGNPEGKIKAAIQAWNIRALCNEMR